MNKCDNCEAPLREVLCSGCFDGSAGRINLASELAKLAVKKEEDDVVSQVSSYKLSLPSSNKVPKVSIDLWNDVFGAKFADSTPTYLHYNWSVTVKVLSSSPSKISEVLTKFLPWPKGNLQQFYDLKMETLDIGLFSVNWTHDGLIALKMRQRLTPNEVIGEWNELCSKRCKYSIRIAATPSCQPVPLLLDQPAVLPRQNSGDSFVSVANRTNEESLFAGSLLK